jgi:hypothetical protein
LAKGHGPAKNAQKRLLASGSPPISALAAGWQFYREALRHIATLTEVRVLTVGYPSVKIVDAYHLWFWMCNALLVERPRQPRPRLSLAVLDGRDTRLRETQDLVAWRFYRAFPACQPYVKVGTRWFVGGSVLHDSALSPFIQMADLIAGAARLAVIGSEAGRDWYQQDLREYASNRGRPIDVSRHARSQLRERSRHDACGSGWKDAILVP